MEAFEMHIAVMVDTLAGYRTTLTFLLGTSAPDYCQIADLARQAASVQNKLDGMHLASRLITPAC